MSLLSIAVSMMPAPSARAASVSVPPGPAGGTIA